MSYLEAVILAIVEGVTEFLPVSSTGHMIITAALLGMKSTPFVKTFTVAIQFGAILAVVALYFERFIKDFKVYPLLIIGVIPAIVFGLLLNDWIDQTLERVDFVGFGLLTGGVILLFIDRLFKSAHEAKPITPLKALIIGLFQCIAILLPGISRSAATIIGGLSQRLTRSQAAEFSFLLAVPTMFAATGYKILSHFSEGNGFTEQEVPVLILGNIVAFIVAWIAIKGFIRFIQNNGLFVFGVYRIIAGLIILGMYYAGVNMSLL